MDPFSVVKYFCTSRRRGSLVFPHFKVKHLEAHHVFLPPTKTTGRYTGGVSDKLQARETLAILFILHMCVAVVRYYKFCSDADEVWYLSRSDERLNIKPKVIQMRVPPSLTCNQKNHGMKWQSISNSHSGPM